MVNQIEKRMAMAEAARSVLGRSLNTVEEMQVMRSIDHRFLTGRIDSPPHLAGVVRRATEGLDPETFSDMRAVTIPMLGEDDSEMD